MDLLGDYRTEIDKIDKEMTKLLEKRMNISKSISKYKMEHDMQIFHPEREKIVIEKNKGYLENKEYGDLVESYYDNLMYLSRLVQQKEIYSENNIYTKPYKNDRENLVVGYQGVPGSFGNEAMLKYFKNIKEAKSYEKFEDVFKAVEDGEIEYGILPVENSSTGGIGTVKGIVIETANPKDDIALEATGRVRLFNLRDIGNEDAVYNVQLYAQSAGNGNFYIMAKTV